MGRRRKDSIPQVRNHKGQARLRLSGSEYYCGRFGSPEAIAEADRLIGEWLTSGRTKAPSPRVEPCEVVTPEKSPPTPEQRPPVRRSHRAPHEKAVAAISPAETEITIVELSARWLTYIETHQCGRGKNRTSRYYTARQAINALEDHWDDPVSQFGTKALLDVQSKLANTPCTSRPADPKKKKPKQWTRVRQGVNSIVTRIRALFQFGVLQQCVDPGQVVSLKCVPPLKYGETHTQEGYRKTPVEDRLVTATLPHLPDAVADLVRFARRTGCRPQDARLIRPCDIDRRPLPEYRGVWGIDLPP